MTDIAIQYDLKPRSSTRQLTGLTFDVATYLAVLPNDGDDEPDAAGHDLPDGGARAGGGPGDEGESSVDVGRGDGGERDARGETERWLIRLKRVLCQSLEFVPSSQLGF